MAVVWQSIWHTTGAGGDGASTYTQEKVFAWLRDFEIDDPATEGIVPASTAYPTPFLVTAGAGAVTIANGAASVYGCPVRLTAGPDSIAIANPAAATRIDRIVLRLALITDPDGIAQTIHTVRAIRIPGAEGGAAPDITQDSDAWDIKLAAVTVTTGGAITVADERVYRHAPGMVKGAYLDTDVADGTTLEVSGGHVQVKDGGVTAAKMADRTVSFFVPCVAGYNGTAVTALVMNSAIGMPLADAKICYGYGNFRVPTDYVSGMTIKALVRPNASGNIYAGGEADYGAVGESGSLHTDPVADAAIAVTQAQNCEIVTITPASVAVGDYVELTFTRTATSALDTVNDVVYFPGWLVTYVRDH